MSNDKKAQTVRSLFEAFTAQDRPTAEALLGNGFRFTTPYDEPSTKPTYYCKLMNGKGFRDAEVHRFYGGKIRLVEVFFERTYKKLMDE